MTSEENPSRRRWRAGRVARLVGALTGALVLALAGLVLSLMGSITQLRQASAHLHEAERLAKALHEDDGTATSDRIAGLLTEAAHEVGPGSAPLGDGWRVSVLRRVPVLGGQVRAVQELRTAAGCGVDLGRLGLPVATAALHRRSGTSPLERVLAGLRTQPDLFTAGRRDLACVQGSAAALGARRTWWPVSGPARRLQRLAGRTLPQADSALDAVEGLQRALGPGHHRYLIVLGNPAEQRPGGGFIGMVGTLDARDGRLRTDFRDSYFRPSKVKGIRAPRALDQHLFQGVPWELPDANWSADFPTSAASISRFWEGETGQDVDGVLTISTPVVADLLGVTGPLRLPPYPQRLTKENLLVELNAIANKVRPGDPGKDYLVEFGHRLLTRLGGLDAGEFSRAGKVLTAHAREQDVALWFRDPAVQRLVERHDLDSALEPARPGQDVVVLTDANLSGGKNDLFVRRSIAITVDRRRPGPTPHTVTVTYTQPAPRNALERGLQPGSGGAYRNYIEVRMPAGSALTDMKVRDAAGLRRTGPEAIDTEKGLARLSFFLMLSPGETAAVTFEYTTPEGLRDLLVVKQLQQLAHPATVTVLDSSGRHTWAGTRDRDLCFSLTSPGRTDC